MIPTRSRCQRRWLKRKKPAGANCSRYPRSMAAACTTALSQTGGVGILMWIAVLFVMVLKITPAETSYLMIWVGILGIIGRVVASGMSDVFGPRWSGFLIGMGGAVAGE